jgi:Fe-S-cluster-containing hydrogenase component 2
MDAPGDDGEQVRRSVSMMTELLMADHLKEPPAPAPGAKQPAPAAAADNVDFNELRRLANRCKISASRFDGPAMLKAMAPAAPAKALLPTAGGIDTSSPVFVVDHSACILCDRCARACDDVKQNNVIGRTGKGYPTEIGFDLNQPMGESSCVQCGECMVSCPTSAITFNPVGKVKLPTHGKIVEVIPAAELVKDPLFASVPAKFLLWQEGLVRRRHVKKGEILCRLGEPGNTAFVIKTGKLEVTLSPQGGAKMKVIRTPADVIVGEMACLSGSPRTADITALEDGEVWEVRRNVLDRMLRSPAQKERFDNIYRKNALENALLRNEIFQGVPADEFTRCVEFLRPKLTFVRVSPKQIIYQQGDWADNMYLIRLGHVRVEVMQGKTSVTVLYLAPGTLIGEIGLLAITPEDAVKTVDQVVRELELAMEGVSPEDLPSMLPSGQRTAACAALDHVELAKINRKDFLLMVQQFPTVRRRLVETALKRLGRSTGAPPAISREHVAQGLYQGQSLLVLDLNSCTRCDECTKACVDQHGTKSHGVPVTRLLREGLRFGDFLVATSCRSCKDAYCMVDCPVDAIHRGKHQQIVIEDHCIGCGLCANNCPYGNISMVRNESRKLPTPDPEHPGEMRMVAQLKAAVCDLCDADGKVDHPKPRCVQACPHDAAHRMTGDELLKQVVSRATMRT